MRFDIVEHKRELLVELVEADNDNVVFYNRCLEVKPRTFINRGKAISYYKIHFSGNRIELEADYYIGADWIIPSEKFVYVAPKINTKLIEKFEEEINKEEKINGNNTEPIDYRPEELNYLKMFLDAAAHPEVLKHTKGLLFIDWEAPEIQLTQEEKDLLTPFLVVQYLNLLKQLVRKGLKKSYYKVTHNLQSKVKGKILVGQNIKTNIFKNRLTNTICEYQEFGIDTMENRFLKKVLKFVSTYIANNQKLFSGNENELMQMIGYCNPAFENVSNEYNEDELRHVKANPFFKEYKEAIKIGKLILKRFAYNISNAAQSEIVTTPPFWIDMPRLFELYVYHLLLKENSNKTSNISYQFSTYGNYLDFLIRDGANSMVVDAKYKLQYENGKVHNDMRQVAGYARLTKVRNEVSKENNNFSKETVLPCLIVYPSIKLDDSTSFKLSDLIDENRAIKAYHKIYKLGISLPVI